MQRQVLVNGNTRLGVGMFLPSTFYYRYWKCELRSEIVGDLVPAERGCFCEAEAETRLVETGVHQHTTSFLKLKGPIRG